MPVIHKSTIRGARQAENRRARNQSTMNNVKTVIKKVQSAVAEKKADDAKTFLRQAVSAIGKAATKGALKPNTASRRISRLTLHVNGLSASRS
ncbi:MAG: 30S ribosomal protein S20 [Nitrospira sp.]|nr:30S ribosomal protein S20 [Nitrospira sp.]MDH4327009.1 30S ribosomal protein S20 [Nitrospira sp.]MDH5253284.1 30S ribosomal protein S20 [Nitrospira sp.]MDH5625221.1 30S ribosomal protein S20 [Nitrospira sp.]